MASNLLTSNHGLELTPEICLSVLEEVIADEPKGTHSLMKLSQAFHDLLKTYEYSITSSIINSRLHTSVNSKAPVIISAPTTRPIARNTYPWLIELQTRENINKAITNDEYTQFNNLDFAQCASFWTSPIRLPYHEKPEDFSSRVIKLKQDGLQTLYELWDLGVEENHIYSNDRSKHRKFFEKISISDLAVLAYIVEKLGLGYYLRVGKQHKLETVSAREYMCVFQDGMLRCGPYFVCAEFDCWPRESCGREREYVREWSRDIMENGLKHMVNFERGEIGRASMRSVVWRVISEREGCGSPYESWVKVKELVKGRMSKY